MHAWETNCRRARRCLRPFKHNDVVSRTPSSRACYKYFRSFWTLFISIYNLQIFLATNWMLKRFHPIYARERLLAELDDEEHSQAPKPLDEI